jgi:glutathione S-transferase
MADRDGPAETKASPHGGMLYCNPSPLAILRRAPAATTLVLMPIRLYDLAGEDVDRRFSPYCWRTRMALAHKGLAVETVPWRFTEKDAIAFTGQGRVPVIVDGERAVNDSWAIAQYLEDTYPDRAPLFPDGRNVARFVNSWADTIQLPGLIRLVVADIHAHLHPKDRDYFRETREKRLGVALEEAQADRTARVSDFRRSLEPLRVTVAAQPYLSGEEPAYPDYIVFGAFQWARSVSDFRLLEPDDPVAAWRGRMLDLFDGLARKAKGYAA